MGNIDTRTQNYSMRGPTVTEDKSFRVSLGVPIPSLNPQQPVQSPLQPQAPPQAHEPPQHNLGSSTGLPPAVGGGGTRCAIAKNFSRTGDSM